MEQPLLMVEVVSKDGQKIKDAWWGQTPEFTLNLTFSLHTAKWLEKGSILRAVEIYNCGKS